MSKKGIRHKTHRRNIRTATAVQKTRKVKAKNIIVILALLVFFIVTVAVRLTGLKKGADKLPEKNPQSQTENPGNSTRSPLPEKDLQESQNDNQVPPPSESIPAIENTKPVLHNPGDTIEELREQQIALALRLIEEFPESEEPLLILAKIYRRLGNSGKALELWNQSLKINPNRFDVYQNIGLLAFETDQYAEAIVHWKKALELNPNIIDLRRQLAQALIRENRYPEAIEILNEELSVVKDSVVAHYLMGRSYLQLKDYDKAREFYEKTIELDPNHTNAHYGLSTVWARLKDQQKAGEHLAIFKELKEKDISDADIRNKTLLDNDNIPAEYASILQNAAMLYIDNQQFDRAEQILNQALAIAPEDQLCLERLGAVYQSRGRTGEALAQFQKICRINPNNPFGFLNSGMIYSQLNQFNEAENAISKAIELDSKSAIGYHELARLYLRANRKLPQARVMAESAVALQGHADNYFILGWACDVNNDRVSAIAAMKRAVELAPENARYRLVYEQVLKRQ